MESIQEASIYVGTYAKYNDGSIFGDWLKLSDFGDKNDFYTACKELHEDEEDPELMFQDWEHIPEGLVGECWVSANVFNLISTFERIDPSQQEAFAIWCEYGNHDLNKEDVDDLYNSFQDDLEIVDNGVGRAYARVIPDASANSFKPFFQDHIDKDAIVTTDEWNGYKPLKIEWKNIEQMKSENGKNFPDIHLHIMNIKSWLHGIHHHCSEQRLQGYLDEFHFRYNRRNNMDTIFDLLIRRMVRNEPTRLNMWGR